MTGNYINVIKWLLEQNYSEDNKIIANTINQLLDGLKIGNNKQYEVKQKREHRSLDANGYCWTLISKLSSVLGNTKEEVYREYVKEVGKYEIVPVKDEAVDMFIDSWNRQGLGNIAEVFCKSRLDGYTNIVIYFGTSTYNTKEFSQFVDYIVNDCKEQGIDTLTPDEILELNSKE